MDYLLDVSQDDKLLLFMASACVTILICLLVWTAFNQPDKNRQAPALLFVLCTGLLHIFTLSYRDELHNLALPEFYYLLGIAVDAFIAYLVLLCHWTLFSQRLVYICMLFGLAQFQGLFLYKADMMPHFYNLTCILLYIFTLFVFLSKEKAHDRGDQDVSGVGRGGFGDALVRRSPIHVLQRGTEEDAQ